MDVGESFGHFSADAGDFFDWECEHEVGDFCGRHGELAVGFAPVAGDFGDEFIGADAGGGGEAGFFVDELADGLGGLGCGFFEVADIEEGFVE